MSNRIARLRFTLQRDKKSLCRLLYSSTSAKTAHDTTLVTTVCILSLKFVFTFYIRLADSDRLKRPYGKYYIKPFINDGLPKLYLLTLNVCIVIKTNFKNAQGRDVKYFYIIF